MKPTEPAKITSRIIIRLLLYLCICGYVYSESGLVTTMLFAYILIENTIYRNLLEGVYELIAILSKQMKELKELMDFRNEYRKNKRDTK